MYNKEIPSYGDVITVAEFIDRCQDKNFIDYDGHGNPARDGMCASLAIKPSALENIPADATHIVWYNR